jgi:hypothetical protein
VSSRLAGAEMAAASAYPKAVLTRFSTVRCSDG